MGRIKRMKWELLFLVIGILLTVIARDYAVDHRLALGLDPSWGGEYLIIPLMLIIYAVIKADWSTE